MLTRNCLSCIGECFDVHLKTRKSAQTGLAHGWTLHANDDDPKICPMQALIRLAVLYGENIELSGPLFLKVNNNGAIMQESPLVSQPTSSFENSQLIISATDQQHAKPRSYIGLARSWLQILGALWNTLIPPRWMSAPH